MSKRTLKHMLQSSVPNPPQMFSDAMRATLGGITQAGAQQKHPSKRNFHTKRRLLVYAIIAIVLIASVAVAAVLLHSNVFTYTMGATPENAESITHYNLAAETIGNAEVKVTEAAYDGISLFISYSIRDLTADEPLGMYDARSDMRLLTEADYQRISALGVGWWVDHIWIDGQSVDMPGMSGGMDVGTDTPGEILCSTLYRLDQEALYLDGVVEIAMPIGERQSLDSLIIDREKDQVALPDQGMVSFTLDCSSRDQVIELTPNIETVGPRWRAKVSSAIITPIQTYITVDWAVDPDVMQAYIDENGEGFADEDGNFYWMYDGVDAVGFEVQSLELVNADGEKVFTSWDGFYGNQGIGPSQAWFTFPYTDALPDELYLAPSMDGGIDMDYAVRIR